MGLMGRAAWALSVCSLALVVSAAPPPSLHDLARRSDPAALRAALQEEGVDAEAVNALDAYGWTPLFWAVDAGNVDAARVLMQHKADPNKGREGWSALMWACGGSKAKELVQLFLGEFKADPNVPSQSGKTALMVAASTGNVALLDTLLAAGAALDPKDKDGNTALTLATQDGHAQVVEALLAAGADVSSVAPLLGTVVSNSHVEVAELLLAKGVEVDTKNADGVTPLMVAAERSNAAMARALLDRGADVNDATWRGVTPLMFAARAARDDTLQLLLDRGAKVEAKSEEGLTPLLYAASGGNDAAAAALLRAGADVRLATAEGRTALELAGAAEMPALRNAAAAALAAATPAAFTAQEVSLWLCLQRQPAWVPLFREAALAGAPLFADEKHEKGDAAFSPEMLGDAFKVLKWAVSRSHTKLALGLLDAGLVSVEAAFTRAASEMQHAVVKFLSTHPALPLHAPLASPLPNAAKATALELAYKLGKVTAADLELRVRAHLRETPVDQWSAIDVTHAMLVNNHHVLRAPFLHSGVDGARLLRLAPEKVAARDISPLTDSTRVLHWALEERLPEVVKVSAVRGETARLVCDAMTGEGATPLEVVVGAPELESARASVLAAVVSVQQGLPLTQWAPHHVVNWLHVVGLGDLAAAFRADGIVGRSLVGLVEDTVEAVEAAQPEALVKKLRGRHRAMELRAAWLLAEGRLLQWAFAGRHRAVAAALTAAALDVRTPEGHAAWVGLHGALPKTQPPVSALQVAVEEGWEEVVGIAGAVASARLATLPLTHWSSTDVTNFVLARGEAALGAAFRHDGQLGGADLLSLAGTYSALTQVLTNGTALLQWAVAGKHRAVAAHLLTNVPIDAPAWEGAGPALEVAKELGLTGAVPGLRARATAALAAAGSLEAWSPADVSNWLHLYGGDDLPDGVAGAMRADGVDGAALSPLAELAPNGTGAAAEPAARALTAARDPFLRLLWSVSQQLPATSTAFIKALPRDQMGPVMLTQHAALPEGGTLLGLFFKGGALNRRPEMDNMGPVVRDFLSTIPVAEWGDAEVAAWLHLGGTSFYVRLFESAGVRGAKLASLLEFHGVAPSVAAATVSKDVLVNNQRLLLWALRHRVSAVAVHLVTRQHALAHVGTAGDAMHAPDTALGLAMAGGADMETVRSAIQEHVLGRLEGTRRAEAVPQERWTAEDVANWQYVYGAHHFVGALYASGVDGAMLLSLSNPLNVTMFHDPSTLLLWAVREGHTAVVKQLLAAGNSVDAADEYGTSLLMQAAWTGRSDIVAALLDAGASKDTQNSNGYTALMRAALKGRARAVNTLVRYGANVHLTNSRGKTAADLAKSKGHSAIADLLLQRQSAM